MDSEAEKLQLLKRTIIGNILSFAKGVDWHVDRQIIVPSLEVDSIKTIKVKGVNLVALDIYFQCNVSLPIHLGLGKHTSL